MQQLRKLKSTFRKLYAALVSAPSVPAQEAKYILILSVTKMKSQFSSPRKLRICPYHVTTHPDFRRSLNDSRIAALILWPLKYKLCQGWAQQAWALLHGPHAFHQTGLQLVQSYPPGRAQLRLPPQRNDQVRHVQCAFFPLGATAGIMYIRRAPVLHDDLVQAH